ncbi:MAG: gluconate 2-dehydrogenase subunit 3 family protein [Novosphingobium sp.]
MDDFLDMDRRSMLGRMAFLLGAAALPVEALAVPAPRARRFLNPARMALLSAVADTMIPKTDTPGAIDAKVPAKFDALLLNWASPARKIELVGALASIDAKALAQEKASFVALSPEKRTALLSAHDLAALKIVPDTRHLTGMVAMMAGPAVADPAYAKLRELIILLFFYSEEALTSVLTYEHNPGGWTPSIKVTPETRNTGGLGMF